MLELKTHISRSEIEADRDPFLVYALTSIVPAAKKQSLPLNLALLIDADFLSPDRDYQLNFVAMLTDLVAGLDGESTFSITVVKASPKVYLSSGSIAENGPVISGSLRASLMSIHGSARDNRLSVGMLLESLKMALAESEQAATPNRINRIVYFSKRAIALKSDSEAAALLDFAKSLRNRRSSNQAQFGIDVYAVGQEVNQNLLIDLVEASAGRYTYLSGLNRLPQLLKVDCFRLSRSVVMDLFLEVKLFKGVKLNRAYLVGPWISRLAEPMPKHENLDEPRTETLLVGDLEPNQVGSVLLELMAPARPQGKVRLCTINCQAYQPFLGGTNDTSQVVVNYVRDARVVETPLPLARSVALCSAVRLYVRAEECFLKGDSERGISLLKSCYGILKEAQERHCRDSLRLLLDTIEPGTVSNFEQTQLISSPSQSGIKAFDLAEIKPLLFALRSDMRLMGLRANQQAV